MYIVRGQWYSSCMRSSMLHGSETCPVRKQNTMALERTDMKMVRWMYGIKVKDRVPKRVAGKTRIG